MRSLRFAESPRWFRMASEASLTLDRYLGGEAERDIYIYIYIYIYIICIYVCVYIYIYT